MPHYTPAQRRQLCRRRQVGGPVYNDVDPAPFETVKAAANALGLHPNSVYVAVNERERVAGRMWAYVGRPLPTPPPPKRAVVCRETGESWPNLQSCADALWVSRNRVCRWLGTGVPLLGRVLRKGPDWRDTPRASRPRERRPA